MQHLSDLRALPPGTQLIAKRRGYTHFGIYVGCGRVIHYAGRLSYPQGLVEEIPVADFGDGRPVYVYGAPDAFASVEDIVRRARSRLGESAYDLLLNNCEHFCNWCWIGESRSAQVDELTRYQRLLVRAIERLILAGARAARYALRKNLYARDSRILPRTPGRRPLGVEVPASSLTQAA
jgi:Lecithin retinol acyltransferase